MSIGRLSPTRPQKKLKMNLDPNILFVLIVCCEIAFWLLLCLGLTVRYLMGFKKMSLYILICVPLIDLFLLLFTVSDLNNGNKANFSHGLATAYIGFTVAFGSILIAWTDKWFAYKFANGPPPSYNAKNRLALVIEDLKLWLRCIGAAVVIYALLIMMIEFVGDSTKTEALNIWFKIPLFTIFFWFLFGPLWSLVFFKRASQA
jgi:hypothetical protein